MSNKYTHIRLNTLLKQTLTEYITTTHFGIFSFWKHGSRGFDYANKLLALLDSSYQHDQIFYIIYTVYSICGAGLKNLLTKKIIYSGIFDNLYELSKNYTDEEAIKFILIENMGSNYDNIIDKISDYVKNNKPLTSLL